MMALCHHHMPMATADNDPTLQLYAAMAVVLSWMEGLSVQSTAPPSK